VPFRKGIEAGSRAFMAAYNKYNGIPCCLHPVLEDVARAEWGHDGIICTDGGAFGHLVTEHRYFPTLVDAVEPVLSAGITQFLDKFKEPVEQALAAGLLNEADIERAIRPTFRVMIRLGLLDPPELVPYAKVPAEPPWESPEARAFVRRVTARSAVLLKNDGSLLPLDEGALRSLAVIGPRADEVLLDWYSGTPPYAVSPLEGIRARLGTRVEVRHAHEGAAAVELARQSDAVVVCVGNHPTGEGPFGQSAHPSYGKESVDRVDLALPDEPFIREVLAVNPRTVVVLVASFPYSIVETAERAPADEVLRRVGRLLAATVRPGDLAVRLGGDEFALLLQGDGLTVATARQRALELRAAVSAETWSDVAPGLAVTVSVGMAVTTRDADARPAVSPPVLYRDADAALYAAKRDGSGLVARHCA
jgi:beta-glucosidase